MLEGRWSTIDRSLHIYARSDESIDTKTEYYSLPQPKVNKNRRFQFISAVRKIIRKPRVRRRKFPRTTREHTEFDKFPCSTTCPNCLSYIRTEVYHYSTCVTHAVAVSLTLVCLCTVPYNSNKYKNTAHYCPRCNIFLGTKFGKGRNIFFCCI